MLSEGRGKERVGCAPVMFASGLLLLSFVGGFVVVRVLVEWLT